MNNIGHTEIFGPLPFVWIQGANTVFCDTQISTSPREYSRHIPIDLSISAIASFSAESTWIAGTGVAGSSSSAIEGSGDTLGGADPLSAASPAYQSTDSLLLERALVLGASERSACSSYLAGAVASCAGGEGALGAALICGGGAVSPRTLPASPVALRS